MRMIDVGQEAYGVIAIGQVATGVVAIGQVATGFIAIGQLARGVFVVGMLAFGVVAAGMASFGLVATAGLVGAGGRGVGGVLRLMPKLERIDRKPRLSRPEAVAEGQAGWLSVKPEMRDGEVRAVFEGEVIPGAGNGRVDDSAAEESRLYARVSRSGGALVCHRLVRPPSGRAKAMIVGVLQLCGLFLLALAFWSVVAPPLIEDVAPLLDRFGQT